MLVLSFLCPISKASTPYFSWDSGLALSLPAYNTLIIFDSNAYFDSFTWDQTVATNITFANIGLQDSSKLSSLTVLVESANVTFTGITNAEIDFNLTQPTRSVYTLPSKPDNVTLNGISYGEGMFGVLGNWTWASSLNQLTLYTANSNEYVSFIFYAPTIPNAGLIFGFFGVCLAALAFALVLGHSHTRREIEP
jgi:hypothetical protein